MNRKITMLRLMFCRNGHERAKYLKKKNFFYKQGENCFFIPFNYGTEPYLISWGNNDFVASGVTFVTHDVTGMMFQQIEPSEKHIKRVGTIEVGDNVFIGANATILYDVKIGNNVIIAAGSLVNKDIPDGTIYGGVPAKEIGKFDDYLKKNRVYSNQVPWNDQWETMKKRESQIKWCWESEK